MAEMEKCSIDAIQIGQGYSKATVRGNVWKYLKKHNILLDPMAPTRRIYNFKGSDEAVSKLCTLKVFMDSKVVLIDLDQALQEMRFRTLVAGKTLLSPRKVQNVVSRIVPGSHCNLELMRSCAAGQGIEQYGKAIDIDEKVSVDIYIVGSVAVSPTGVRIGKGGGSSDLEYAMLASLGNVDQNTRVITMVHDCQVLDLPDSMFRIHDVPIDIIVTPTRIIECTGNLQKPSGILWELLDDHKLNDVPVLKKILKRQWKARREKTSRDPTTSTLPVPPADGSFTCRHDKSIGRRQKDLVRCQKCGWMPLVAPDTSHVSCGGKWGCDFCSGEEASIENHSDLEIHISTTHLCEICSFCYKTL